MKTSNFIKHHFIEDALIQHYNIDTIAQITYLGERDNYTYRIKTITGEKYVLKGHKGNTNQQQIQSELLWIEALQNDTDLQLQSPIRNKNNELTTNLTNDQYYWTLQAWIEGETLDRQPTDTELEQLAKLMATLHQHASSWEAPTTLDRPHYDGENLVNALNELNAQLTADTLTASDLETLEQTSGKILSVINKQEKTPSIWGLIHSDIHESNYVFHGGKPAVIDFSCCGFGFYLFDLAETLLHLVPENRKKLITYYQQHRHLQEDYQEVLEAFFLWAVIRNFAFLSKNTEEHTVLAVSIPAIVEKFCSKFLKGQHFLGA